MPETKKDTQAVAEQAKAADAVREQAKAADRLVEQANQAAERAPTLDTDLAEVLKDAADPTSQRAPSRIHAMTTEYAGYINTGRPERAQQVEDQLAKEGYDVNGIRLADSPSLPQHVAEEENARSPEERRRKAKERGDFALVSGRRVPDPARVAESKKGTGKDPAKIHPDNS